MALTTPSRLTRKKKQRAVPEPSVSEEEKENGDMLGSGGSFLRGVAKTPRRRSTIQAGNLPWLSGPPVGSTAKKETTGAALNNRVPVGQESIVPSSGRTGSQSTEFFTARTALTSSQHQQSEDSFHSCQQSQSPPSALNKSWMTDVSDNVARWGDGQWGRHQAELYITRDEDPDPPKTPMNFNQVEKPKGSSVKAAQFFSVGRRGTVSRTGHERVLVSSSSDEEDGVGPLVEVLSSDSSGEVRRVPQPGYRAVIRSSGSDSDDSRGSEHGAAVEVVPDSGSSNSHEDVPPLKLGKEYLSNSRYEKLVVWVTESPFSSRLESPSGEISPGQHQLDVVDVDSLLDSDSDQEKAYCPSWAAPLPQHSGGTSKAGISQEASTAEVSQGTSKAGISHETETSRVGTSHDTSRAEVSQGTSKADISHNASKAETSQGTSKAGESQGTSKAGISFSNSNQRTSQVELSEEENSLNRTMEKLELSESRIHDAASVSLHLRLSPSQQHPVIKPSIGTQPRPQESSKPTDKIFPSQGSRQPDIDNSLDCAVRCWGQPRHGGNRREPVKKSSASGSEDTLDRHLKTVKNNKPGLPGKGKYSEDEDEFDSDFDTPKLNFKERIMNKISGQAHQAIERKEKLQFSDSSQSPEIIKAGRKKKSLRKKTLFSSDECSENERAQSPIVLTSDDSFCEPGPEIYPVKPKTLQKRQKKAIPAKTPNTVPKLSSQNQPKTPTGTLTFLASLTENTPINRCHPESLPYKKNYKRNKEELARRLYNLYNKECFNYLLPADMKIDWNVKLTKTAGLCYTQRHTDRFNVEVRECRIELSNKVLTREDRLRDTLVHEMCHAAAWIVCGYRDGHGPLWRKWAEIVRKRFPELPVIGRCHSYEIEFKFWYRCVNCGYTFGRHSKSLDLKKKVCGYCRGEFELLRKGNTLKPAKLNPFAEFVQKNFKTYKKAGMNHGDVMKIMSEKYAATKRSKK